jgi:energy-coupling factor transporter ATP-binding protein EcfA2
MDRALTVDRLSAHYAGARSPALLRLSFDLAKGDSLAILGPAGAGKTTLLHAIAGLLHAQEGAVVEGNIRVGNADPYAATTLTAFPAVSMLPQDPRHTISGFVPTVQEELQITLRQARIPMEQWEMHLHAIMDRLPIAPLLTRAPGTLSGGEMQTVALAIAAVSVPAILCLDEPATALDQGRVDDLTRFILRRPPEMAIIVADATLHAPVLACKRTIVLDHGSMVFAGSREDFWQRLPEFQDLVALGAWLDLWHVRSSFDAPTFQNVLERAC